MIVEGVEYGSDFDIECWFQRTSVENVFFHHDGFLIGLEEDEEVGFKEFEVEIVGIGHVLFLLEGHLLEKRFGVDS